MNILKFFQKLKKTNKNTPTSNVKIIPTISQHSENLNALTTNLDVFSQLTQKKDK